MAADMMNFYTGPNAQTRAIAELLGYKFDYDQYPNLALNLYHASQSPDTYAYKFCKEY